MNNIGTDGIDVVWNSLLDLWNSVVNFLPELVIALIVLILGWVVAVLVAKLVWHAIKAIQLDRALESIGFKRVWERSGYRLDSAKFFYELVKWFFVVVFVTAATDILGLREITNFLRNVVNYIPNVIVAGVVMIIGVLVARFVEGLLRGSSRMAEIGSAHVTALIVKWAVLIFALSVALDQLAVDSNIIDYVVIGVVSALALGFGLAFGLGGKAHADEAIANFKRKMMQ